MCSPVNQHDEAKGRSSHVSELLVAVHLRDAAVEVIDVQEGGREAEDARSPVVHQVDEDSVVGATPQHLSATHALQALGVTAQHLQEVLRGDLCARVVLGHAGVHVGAVRSVDDHARSRVSGGDTFVTTLKSPDCSVSLCVSPFAGYPNRPLCY